MLGVLKSIFQTFFVSKQTMEVKADEENESLDIALANNLSPQLESLEKETLDILYEIVSDGDPISRFKEYEANEIKRPEYKKSFGMFLDLLGLEKGECKNREAQFASKDSVFVKPGTAQAKNFEEELGFLYTKSGWENRNLKKFAESLEEIRKTMI